jgi:hypothetical protein
VTARFSGLGVPLTKTTGGGGRWRFVCAQKLFRVDRQVSSGGEIYPGANSNLVSGVWPGVTPCVSPVLCYCFWRASD